MSDVRVHAGSPQPAQVGALAYAQGNDIHLASGQERHLPHEAWHVAQQKAGRVQPTVQAAGVPINDSPALEAEADRMGRGRSRSGNAWPRSGRAGPEGPDPGAFQRPCRRAGTTRHQRFISSATRACRCILGSRLMAWPPCA